MVPAVANHQTSAKRFANQIRQRAGDSFLRAEGRDIKQDPNLVLISPNRNVPTKAATGTSSRRQALGGASFKAYLKRCSCSQSVFNFNFTPVLLHDPFDDGKPQACPGHLGGEDELKEIYRYLYSLQRRCPSHGEMRCPHR